MVYTPGDILLVNDYTGGKDVIGNLIRAGERARYGDVTAARWTHAALIVGTDGSIAEALQEGVRLTNVSKYDGVETCIIPLGGKVPSACSKFAVQFASARVGDDYDVLDFITLAGSLLTGWDLSLHSDKRFICSGLVSRATECYTTCGYPYPSEQMMPADLAVYWKAEPLEIAPPISFMGRVLDKLKAITRLA